MPYFQFYQTACISHREQPTDFGGALLAQTEKLNARNALEVMVGVEAGNADDIIEMVIR